jgi:hypothetical protein
VFAVIAPEACHLRELGLRNGRIARVLGVSDRTVAKSMQRFGIDHGPATPDEADGPQDD